LFLGGLLKGGISTKQVPAGTRQSEISTASPLGGAGNVSSRVVLWGWVAFGTLLGPGTTTKVVCLLVSRTQQNRWAVLILELLLVVWGRCSGGGVCGGVVV
jgi:hypothetical protein